MNQLIHSQNTVTLYNESWLIKRLRQHGELAGELAEDAHLRQEAIREAIAKAGPGIVAGRKSNGKTMSYKEAYEAVYRMPFVKKKKN